MIRKVLIANRGEVAVRIARACRELGIATVGVYSEADANAMHTRSVDAAVLLGPAPSAQSYLRGERIIDVARDQGCDAIHPGYGFLSQNADFAEAAAAAGIVFIGPPPSAMRLMGDKTAARRSMIEAGVPVVPGYQGSGDESLEVLEAEALKVGFPLLIKAAAGGGGKGMRVVHEASQLHDAIGSARREAEKAFGDGRLFLERFIANAHHVEVQILADAHGKVLHVFERECSVQRRYQKIIEESPSPLLDPDSRERITATAVAAAKACGYVNAGTIEMLVNPADRSFYFLEMNTRLQVEHPVTEMVTGLDLVQWQIRIARGEPLPFEQGDLRQHGHAIECRLYAEDPAADFAPSTGKALLVDFPAGPGIRIDAGIESGDDVPVYYDPLLAKLIVHGGDRDAAVRRMRRVLDETVLLGIANNLGFLRALLEHPAFLAGEISTTFVERELAGWAEPASELADEVFLAAAFADLLGQQIGSAPLGVAEGEAHSPWTRSDGFRVGG